MNRNKTLHNRTVLNQKARRRNIHFRMIRSSTGLGHVPPKKVIFSQMSQNQRARRRMSLVRMMRT